MPEGCPPAQRSISRRRSSQRRSIAVSGRRPRGIVARPDGEPARSPATRGGSNLFDVERVVSTGRNHRAGLPASARCRCGLERGTTRHRDRIGARRRRTETCRTDLRPRPPTIALHSPRTAAQGEGHGHDSRDVPGPSRLLLGALRLGELGVRDHRDRRLLPGLLQGILELGGGRGHEHRAARVRELDRGASSS